MNLAALIGAVLPQAVGIAISPLPIIAAILLLLTDRARTVAPAFLAGWTVGVSADVVVLALLTDFLPDSRHDGSQPVAGTIQILLGAALVFLGARQWLGHHARTDTAAPKWMAAIDVISPANAAGLGLLLTSVNPRI